MRLSPGGGFSPSPPPQRSSRSPGKSYAKSPARRGRAGSPAPVCSRLTPLLRAPLSARAASREVCTPCSPTRVGEDRRHVHVPAPRQKMKGDTIKSAYQLLLTAPAKTSPVRMQPGHSRGRSRF
jgi:hypothetical protein